MSDVHRVQNIVSHLTRNGILKPNSQITEMSALLELWNVFVSSDRDVFAENAVLIRKPYLRLGCRQWLSTESQYLESFASREHTFFEGLYKTSNSIVFGISVSASVPIVLLSVGCNARDYQFQPELSSLRVLQFTLHKKFLSNECTIEVIIYNSQIVTTSAGVSRQNHNLISPVARRLNVSDIKLALACGYTVPSGSGDLESIKVIAETMDLGNIRFSRRISDITALVDYDLSARYN